jgi:hypothetical protein
MIACSSGFRSIRKINQSARQSMSTIRPSRKSSRENSGRSFGEAQALAVELEMRPLEARCRLGIGKLLLETGNRREAGIVLSSAIAMLGEMDMRLWLPEAEAALAAAVAAPLQLKRVSPVA